MIIMVCVYCQRSSWNDGIYGNEPLDDPLFSVLPIDSEIKFYDLYFSGLFAFGLQWMIDI